jgi:hypothetical protein
MYCLELLHNPNTSLRSGIRLCCSFTVFQLDRFPSLFICSEAKVYSHLGLVCYMRWTASVVYC